MSQQLLSEQDKNSSSSAAVSTLIRRSDGRVGGGTLRPLSCELSCLHRADGSALWKSGATQVLAAVYGPVAPKHSRHEHTTALVSVILKHNNSSSSASSSGSASSQQQLLWLEWEDLLTHWLSSAIVVQEYPRSVIQIVLQIIQPKPVGFLPLTITINVAKSNRIIDLSILCHYS